MSLELTSAPTFAGHQTFHPRFGWLRKAFIGVSENPNIFNELDSTVRLGVGKNMVEAIKFWGQALRVIEVDTSAVNSGARQYKPTDFGSFLFDQKTGLDPYLEDESSLWLLHWKMLASPNSVPVWWVVFDSFAGIEFTPKDIFHVMKDSIGATSWKMPSDSSIEKDIDALIRMYSSRDKRARQTLDDMLDSPFRALSLIQNSVVTEGGYRFTIGKKPGLTPSVIAYACIDFMLSGQGDSSVVSLSRLARDTGSPGRLFKLDEKTLQEALSVVASQRDGVSLVDKVGTLQLVVSDRTQDFARGLLANMTGWQS